jgi:hypothetical protein
VPVVPLTLAVVAACTSEPNTPTHPSATKIRVQVSAYVGIPEGRIVDVTAFYQRDGHPAPLATGRFPVDTGEREISFEADITLCFASGSQCPLELAVALRDTAGQFIDSTSVGPIGVGSTATATFPPVILRRVAKIAIPAVAGPVAIGDSVRLTTVQSDAFGTTLAARPVKWTSSAPNIARVSAAGFVTGLFPGRAVITAEREEQSATVAITVPFQAVTRWQSSRPLTPGPTPFNTYGIWAAGPQQIYFAGDGGFAIYDGTAARVVTNSQCCFRAISGSSPTDVHLVGDNTTDGIISYFNGTTILSRPTPTRQFLTGVWASSASLAFAVGDQGTVIRYDGQSWSSMPSPTTRYLRGVCGTSATNVYAVGDSGTVIRFDGTSWKVQSFPFPGDLLGVYCADSTNIFAAGRRQPGQGAVWSFNGSQWTAMTVPQGTSDLRAIHGVSPRDIHAVGSSGALVHFDGSSWSQQVWPWDRYSSTMNAVWSVGGTAFTGGFEGITMAYRGGSWSDIGHAVSYRGLWAASPKEMYAVGFFGGIDRFDGTQWTEQQSGTNRSLLGVWGSAPNDIWATGAEGLVLHSNGTTWTPVTSGTTQNLEDVWGADSRNVFAVGGGGTILRYPGSSWFQMTTGTFSYLRAVWGTSPTEVFAVGNGGTVLRYNGILWTSMVSGVTNDLYGIWGTGSNDIYAVGASETVIHYDGTRWQVVTTGSPPGFYYAVWGSGPSDVYVLGCGLRAAPALRFDGTRWRTSTQVCALNIAGFTAGGAIGVLYFRQVVTGLSPTGNVGSSISTAFRDAPPPALNPGVPR